MRLKVVNLNLWLGGLIWEPLVAWCQNQQADIYLFQEVYSSADQTLVAPFRSYQLLGEKLGLPHGYFAPAFEEDVGGLKIPQGNAVLSRFPLVAPVVSFYDIPYGPRSTERAQFAHIPRNLVQVAAELPTGQQLQLLNTQGIWGEDGFDTPRRLAMGRQIAAAAAAAKTSGPVLLSGDFNVSPNTQTIAQIEAELTNVFAGELKTTFNHRRKDLVKYPGYATAVVDMCFVSPDITVVSHHCPEVDVSDHLPLVVELELSAPG